MAPDEVDDVMPGKDLGTKEVVIDEERMERYIGGIDAKNPWYKTDSPFGGPIAPAAVLYYEPWRFPGWRPPGWGGTLNSKVDWEFFKAVRPGQRLTMKGRIADRYIRRNREFVTIEMSAVNEAEELVCRGSSTGTWTIDPANARPDVPRRD